MPHLLQARDSVPGWGGLITSEGINKNFAHSYSISAALLFLIFVFLLLLLFLLIFLPLLLSLSIFALQSLTIFIRCRISSSIWLGKATVCAISSRNNSR